MDKYVIRNRLRELLAEKARKDGRAKAISQHEVARETGISRYTVDRWARNEITRMDNHVVIALCNFLGCEIGDLIIMETVEDAPENTESGQSETPLSVPA